VLAPADTPPPAYVAALTGATLVPEPVHPTPLSGTGRAHAHFPPALSGKWGHAWQGFGLQRPNGLGGLCLAHAEAQGASRIPSVPSAA
jgi:hypothetical protein